jgi:hypothetical protein
MALEETRDLCPLAEHRFEKDSADTSRLRIGGVVGTYDLRRDDGRPESARNVDG